jgi:hypothetical protein
MTSFPEAHCIVQNIPLATYIDLVGMLFSGAGKCIWGCRGDILACNQIDQGAFTNSSLSKNYDVSAGYWTTTLLNYIHFRMIHSMLQTHLRSWLKIVIVLNEVYTTRASPIVPPGLTGPVKISFRHAL